VGRKVAALQGAGIAVESPDFRGLNLAERVARLVPILAARQRPLVIGSSYGGLTAVCAAMQHVEAGGELTALLLCAPALGRSEAPASDRPLYPAARTVILHGTRDQVVPIEVSRAFAAAHPDVELIEVDDDHRLASSDDQLLALVRRFVAAAR
jgi:pimeloyl-ACP methyl ester carboxylesterase